MASRRADDGRRLLDALLALREALNAPALPAWREVIDAISRVCSRADDHGDEARQMAAIHVCRGVGALRASSPGEAVSWLRTIVRNAERDVARRERRDPVRRALRDAGRDDARDRSPALERLPAPEPTPPQELTEQFVASLIDRVHEHLAATVTSPTKRAGDDARAKAALLRIVFREDAAAIAVELGIEGPIPADRIYKWVERGREILLAALERWAREPDLDELGAAVVEAFRGILTTRRADAGKARPARRSPGIGAGLAGRQSVRALRVLSVPKRTPRS